MAYVPPHRRMMASYNKQQESPTNEIRSADQKIHPSYAYNSITRSFTISQFNHQFPLHLQTVSVDEDLINLKQGEKPMALLKSADAKTSGDEEGTVKLPWEQMAEALMPDLLFCIESVRKAIDNERFDSIDASFVARAGTFLFMGEDQLTNRLINEDSLSKLRKIFYTDVPSSYMDNIMDNVVPRIGLQYGESKDVFHITLLDSLRRGPAISCKCRLVEEGNRLELYKIDLKPVRHMVFDVLCLEKNVDLRLMLSTKKTLTSLPENERKSIEELIGCLVLDPTAEGGIKWPLEKTVSSDNRYRVIRVCRTVTEEYSNSSIRLKVRVAENSGYVSSSTFSGDPRREMSVELKEICSLLLERKIETAAAILDMLKDEMKLLWDHFLHSEKHFIM